MIFAASIRQASLADPPPASAINSATSWVSDLLFGSLATTIAVIAIAWIGFAMLSGRIDIRRGLSVVLGCFLLFGARVIADGLRSTVGSDSSSLYASADPPPAFPEKSPNRDLTDAFDPYAGAAVMRK